ncbi:hypothetical protein [Pelagicoccus albus]|uniref:Uncharacterized protein n=1 Tax=Pelagicoccus albus TaxID=415222 RepID=A0A7X1EA14_9BACT|nr:hypothetical protein [Pelagicoccus albus]MBC2608014.1 hypothetical protein [Pelagicoccus albus]
MNKQRFIEQLNLHLDEELSAEDSAELLDAVRSNPEYHRIYIQYCQLFNACSELGDKFSQQKPITQWRQKLYAVGGMAAAAALLFMAARNLSPFIGNEGTQLVASNTEAQSVNAPSAEPVLVVEKGELPASDFMTLGDAIPVGLDLDKVFNPSNRDWELDSESSRSLTNFKVSRTVEAHAASKWPSKEFGFAKPVIESTYAHEEIGSGMADSESLSIGSAFGGEGYDFGSAAATAPKPRQ